MISSYVGENATFAQAIPGRRAGDRIQPAGHAGRAHPRRRRRHSGFYTATGAGTQIAEGKETKEFDGRTYVMERGLRADLAIMHAWKADHRGQSGLPEDGAELQSDHGHRRRGHGGRGRGTRRAAARSIPDHIITPGIFVNRIVPLETVDKRIEQRTVRKRVS